MGRHHFKSGRAGILLLMMVLGGGCSSSTSAKTTADENDSDTSSADSSSADEPRSRSKTSGIKHDGGSKPSASSSNMGQGVTMSAGFDGESSVEAFKRTLYPTLRQRCAKCHSEAPEGTGQKPLHASSDPVIAHDEAISKINLRQVTDSKLVERQAREGHNCWGDCTANGEQIRIKAQAWADAVQSTLPKSTLEVPDGEVSEEQVLAWIAADKAKLSAADKPYIQYASLHRLQNTQASPDDMNTARVGLSKILNSTSMYGPKIVNPVPIDKYSLVYRFDIRSYWGFGSGSVPDAQRAVDTWKRVKEGNRNADDQTPGPNTFANKDTPTNSMAKDTPTFPNIAGFYPDYTDATQLGYTLSRPDVYADVMSLGTNSAFLERRLGVESTGIESWKWVTVDDAITINKRMLLRSKTPTGFFWKGVDPFAQSKFIFYERPIPEFDVLSLVKTTPIIANGTYDMASGLTLDANGKLAGGPQAQASEMIFSLPNGLQAYFIGGAANQIRIDAFPFIVVDPRRGGPLLGQSFFRTGPGSDQRLLTPASCMSCHFDGLNRTVNDMHAHLAAEPDKFDTATLSKVKALYPTTEEVRTIIEADRAVFGAAMRTIREEMIVGMSDKTIYREPIELLFESAQTLFHYQPTASN